MADWQRDVQEPAVYPELGKVPVQAFKSMRMDYSKLGRYKSQEELCRRATVAVSGSVPGGVLTLEKVEGENVFLGMPSREVLDYVIRTLN